MSTIAEELNRLQDNYERIDGLVDDIAEALENAYTPEITVESLSVTENGTYTAQTGRAYSPVTVNVPTGGGDIVQNKYLTIKVKTITIPANDIQNTNAVHAFFTEKAAEEGASNYISAALVEDYTANNQLVSVTGRQVSFGSMPSAWDAYRYHNNAAVLVSYPSSSYDAVLVEGTHYVLMWVESITIPT